MKKKILALVLVLMTLTAFPMTAMSKARVEKNAWEDGEKFSLDISAPLNVSGGQTLEFTLPFFSDYVTVTTSTPGAEITFEIDGVKNNISLDKKSVDFKFPDVLRRGEKDLVISGNATITGIVFNEIQEVIAIEELSIDLTDYEKAVQSALIMREGSPILKSKMAIRYYDYNNINVKPEYVNGALYVPADALALALEIYWEQDKEKDFFVLRKDKTEIVWVNGEMKYGEDNEYSLYDLDVKEFYGKTYVPLRQIAEAFGYYVAYKDGFIIVDYRSRTKNIFDNFYEELRSEFNSYMPDETAGNTYYVSKSANANDNNDGSREHPWATIEKANQTAKAGDTVIIGEGTWQETIIPVNDGTATSPITFKAEEGKDVYLSATQTITKFADYKDGIVVASVPDALEKGRNQVFYKKKNLIEARYPNPDVGEDGLFEYSSGIRLSPEWITEGDLKVGKTDNSKVYSDTLLQEEEEDYWKGAYFVSMEGYAWSLAMADVVASKKGELSLANMSTYWWWDGTDGINKGYLTCHINCIDQPGEWTVKDGLLYIMLPEGETAKTLELEVKNKQLVADLSDRSYIHLDGFQTFGGSMKMNNSKMCVVNNCDMKYLSHYTYLDWNASLREGAEDDSNSILARGEAGMYITGENNAVVNSKIQYSAGNGIGLWGVNCFAHNNVILDTDYMGSSSGAAIAVNSDSWSNTTDKRGGHTITYNTIKRTGRSSIVLGASGKKKSSYEALQVLPCEVAYNDLCDDSICSLDTGTVYAFGVNYQNDWSYSRMHNNFTYETYTAGPAVHNGFYYDAWAVGFDTFDNLQFAVQNGQYMFEVPVEQPVSMFQDRFATVDSWNNVDLGIKTKDEVTINDFPSAKPFQVGSSLLEDKNDMTYEYYKNNSKVEGIYNIGDMVLSDGVAVNGNKAKFTANDQYIKIENVDFDKFNRVNITYTSDYYTTDDDFLVVSVGDDPEKPIETKTVQLLPEAKYKDDYNFAYALFSSQMGGQHTIWIKPATNKGYDAFGNSEIFQISMGSYVDTFDNYDYDILDMQCGMFSSCGKGDDPLAEGLPIASNSAGRMTTYLWGGNWTQYKGVTLHASVKKFTITLGTGGKYAGLTVQLRVGSVDGPVLAEVTADDTGWGWKEYTVDCKYGIVPGAYDFYLVGVGSGKNSNIGTFSLK